MEKNIILKIKGMACHSCATNIEQALKGQNDVVKAAVDFKKKKALITADEHVDPQKLIDVIENLGYEAALK